MRLLNQNYYWNKKIVAMKNFKFVLRMETKDI